MHGNNKPWADKKKHLARKQEEYNDRQQASTKKLKRVRVTARGKVIVDFDFWPADRSILQRIATHMDRAVSPSWVVSHLEKGEKITNRHGDVYSLVPLTASR